MKRWVFIGIVLVSFGLIATVSIFYFLNKNTLPKPFPESTLTLDSPLQLPTDITVDFDPTSNPPIFKILSIDQKNNIFSLQFVFPKTRISETLSSLITCKNINLSEVIKKFEDNNTINNPTIFSGLCKDASCNEINKLCKLIVYD